MEEKVFQGEVKSVNDFDRTVSAVVSDESIDLYSEVLKVSGWDFSIFERNPVLMLNHSWKKFPIGRALKLWTEGKKLLAKFKFSEATQEAREAFQLLKEGILRGFSVGFLPGEWEPGPKDSDIRKIYTSGHRLLEISLTPLPANSGALALALQRGLISQKTFDGLQIRNPADAAVSIGDLAAVFFDAIQTKPEENSEYIHIPVRDKNDFIKNSFKTFDIPGVKGTQAVGGKLKNPPEGQEGSIVIQKYIFSKAAGWTMESATAWVKGHSKEWDEVLVRGELIFLDEENTPGLVEDLASEVDRRRAKRGESAITQDQFRTLLANIMPRFDAKLTKMIDKKINRARGLIEFPQK